MSIEKGFTPESVISSSTKAEMPILRDAESNRLVDAKINNLTGKERRLNLLTPGELDFIASVLA